MAASDNKDTLVIYLPHTGTNLSCINTRNTNLIVVIEDVKFNYQGQINNNILDEELHFLKNFYGVVKFKFTILPKKVVINYINHVEDFTEDKYTDTRIIHKGTEKEKIITITRRCVERSEVKDGNESHKVYLIKNASIKDMLADFNRDCPDMKEFDYKETKPTESKIRTKKNNKDKDDKDKDKDDKKSGKGRTPGKTIKKNKDDDKDDKKVKSSKKGGKNKKPESESEPESEPESDPEEVDKDEENEDDKDDKKVKSSKKGAKNKKPEPEPDPDEVDEENEEDIADKEETDEE